MCPKKFDRTLLPARPDLSFEKALWDKGIQVVAGEDEAGRGALAGPVCAAAVILPAAESITSALEGVRDSKQMTPAQRIFWEEQIRSLALAYGIGFASQHEIDAGGIVAATRLAFLRALEALAMRPEHLLLDFLDLPESAIPQTCLVKGDARSLSIAAASVLAKTSRDHWMLEMDRQYPGYGLAENKGYGTLAHRQALQSLGPSPIHRLSFRLKEDAGDSIESKKVGEIRPPLP